MRHSFQIRLLDCDIHYEHFKPKEEDPTFSFLLVHGFLGSTFSFRKLAPLLAQKYQVFSLDLVGFGKSEKSRTFPYSYDSYATLIIQFIKSMGLRNVIVVGHSMGGQVALYSARLLPEWISYLVLVGSSGYIHKANRLAALLSYFPFTSWGVKRWLGLHKVEDILKNTFYKDSLITSEMIEAYQTPTTDSNFPYVLMGLLRNREGDLTQDDLKAVKQPTLIIWGEQDEIVPIRVGLKISQDLPCSQFVSLLDAGHQVIEEKPSEVFAEIEKWLHNLKGN